MHNMVNKLRTISFLCGFACWMKTKYSVDFMKSFLTIFLVIAGMNFSSPASAELFVCEAKKYSQLSGSGLVHARTEVSKSWVNFFREFTFDTDTGHLRIKGIKDPYTTFTIVQKGSEQGDDFVATKIPYYFLRIRVWEKEKPFYWDWGVSILSGSCKYY